MSARSANASKPKQRDPSYELRAARIGAWTAAGAAVVAAIATLAVGVMTVHVTAETTDKQIAAESAKARADFLRSQQQTAYATLITDHQALLYAEAGLTTQLTSQQPDDGGAALREVAERIKKLDLTIANIDLVGSPAARDVARQIGTLHADVNHEGVIGYGTVANSRAALKAGDSHLQKIDADMMNSTALMERLVSIARDDIGSDPAKPK